MSPCLLYLLFFRAYLHYKQFIKDSILTKKTNHNFWRKNFFDGDSMLLFVFDEKLVCAICTNDYSLAQYSHNKKPFLTAGVSGCKSSLPFSSVI